MKSKLEGAESVTSFGQWGRVVLLAFFKMALLQAFDCFVVAGCYNARNKYDDREKKLKWPSLLLEKIDLEKNHGLNFFKW